MFWSRKIPWNTMFSSAETLKLAFSKQMETEINSKRPMIWKQPSTGELLNQNQPLMQDPTLTGKIAFVLGLTNQTALTSILLQFIPTVICLHQYHMTYTILFALGLSLSINDSSSISLLVCGRLRLVLCWNVKQGNFYLSCKSSPLHICSKWTSFYRGTSL